MASKISIAITAKNQASGPIGQVTNSLSKLQAQANKGKLSNIGSSIAAGFSSNRGAISEIASFVGKAGIIGGITALTIKIAQMESQWASSVRSMSNLAIRSGLPTTAAFGVQYAGRLAGLSPEQANAGIEQVRQTYSDAINNRNPEALKRFQAAGISTDPNRLESIESVLTKLSSYAQTLRDQGKYGGAQNFLNSAGAGSLGDFLNRGPAQVAADLQAAKAFIPDEQDIQRAKEYADASAKLGITYDRLKMTILSKIEPGLNALLEDLQRLFDVSSGRELDLPKPFGVQRSENPVIGSGASANGEASSTASPSGNAGSSGVPAVGAKIGDARSMVNWYMNHGLSREQAIGVTANAFRESSLDERAADPSGKFVGFFQWGGERQKQFEKFSGRPLSLATPEEQMSFSLWELNNTEKKARDALLQSTDSADAAAKFSSLYERPTDPNEAGVRADIARSIDSQLGDTSSESGGKVRVEIVHKNPPPGTSTNVTSSPNVDTQLKTDRQQAPLGDQYAYSPSNF